jgi:hypothetical protein
MKYSDHEARMGKEECIPKSVRAEGNRKLGRPRNRWEINVKMDLREIE